MCKLKISQWRVCVCVNFGNIRLVLMFFPILTSDPRYIGWLIGIFILFLTSGRPSSGRQCNGMHHQRVRRRHKSRHIFPHFLSSSSRGKDTLVSSNSLFPLLFLYLKLTNTSVNRPASTLHAPHTQTHLIVNFSQSLLVKGHSYISYTRNFRLWPVNLTSWKKLKKKLAWLWMVLYERGGDQHWWGVKMRWLPWQESLCVANICQPKVVTKHRSPSSALLSVPATRKVPWVNADPSQFPSPPPSPFKEAAHFRDPPSLSSILTAPPAPARSSVLWQLLHLDRGTAMATLCNPHGTSPEKTRVALWSKGGWRQSGRPLAPLCTWRQRAQLTFTLVITENKDS